MEKLIREIEAYAAARPGWTPQRVIRAAVNSSGAQWAKWCDGTASPTVVNADRIYAFMANNPPAQRAAPTEGDAA